MQHPNAIAIFDIGKTNKKLFLFDEQYQLLLEESEQIDEITDEDGYPCEDLPALSEWVRRQAKKVFALQHVNIKAINFSAYGASFVHLDKEGNPSTPLYNYLKPFPETLQQQFYDQYGGKTVFSLETASPVLGNLNSGLQLYRLKYERPELFKQIHVSLHLPQYISYLFTKKTYSDITSIGCHTAMWNFSKNQYHEWVVKENIYDKLAPLFPSDELMDIRWNNRSILVGAGLHDSSAALIPYSVNFKEPFVLISTGTWCISLNPFDHNPLTTEELQHDCLCYMEYRGGPVKASRLFAGYRHEQEVKRLAAHFNVGIEYYKTIQPDIAIFSRLKSSQLNGTAALTEKKELVDFANYKDAYHQLIYELIREQVASTNLVLSNSKVQNIFVDGGFGKNSVYMQLLADSYPQLKVHAASVPQATAMGAALAVHSKWNTKDLPVNIIDGRHYPATRAVEL